MADVFVSYASQDRERVAPIVEAIEQRGWSVWWDRAISGGAAFDRAIEQAIDDAGCIVVVWSDASVESEWVRTEANEGLERGVLLPITLDDVRPPLAFRRTQTLEFTDGRGDIEALISALQGIVPVGEEGVAAGETACIGRAAELAQIAETLKGVLESRGALLLVSGEAGVGKTRLMREAMAHARAQDVMCLTGHSSEMEGAPPYEPLIHHIELAVRIVNPVRLRTALGELEDEAAGEAAMGELLFAAARLARAMALDPEQALREANARFERNAATSND